MCFSVAQIWRIEKKSVVLQQESAKGERYGTERKQIHQCSDRLRLQESLRRQGGDDGLPDRFAAAQVAHPGHYLPRQGTRWHGGI